MYELETAKFMFDRIHKRLPKPLMEHFTLNTAYHDHNTRPSHAPHVKGASPVLLQIQYYTKVPQCREIYTLKKKYTHQKLFVRSVKSVYIESLANRSSRL